jgi:hypothetical protein
MYWFRTKGFHGGQLPPLFSRDTSNVAGMSTTHGFDRSAHTCCRTIWGCPESARSSRALACPVCADSREFVARLPMHARGRSTVCSRSSFTAAAGCSLRHGTLPPNTQPTSRRSGEATFVVSGQPLAHCTRPHLRRPPYRPAHAGTCLQLAARPCKCVRAVSQRAYPLLFGCYGCGTAR